MDLQVCATARQHWAVGFNAGQEELVLSSDLLHFVPAENRGAHAVVRSRQLGLLPLPDPGGASFHHAPYRYYFVCLW